MMLLGRVPGPASSAQKFKKNRERSMANREEAWPDAFKLSGCSCKSWLHLRLCALAEKSFLFLGIVDGFSLEYFAVLVTCVCCLEAMFEPELLFSFRLSELQQQENVFLFPRSFICVMIHIQTRLVG